MCSKFFLIAYIITHQNRSHVTILGCNNNKTQKQIVACCLLDRQRQKDAEKWKYLFDEQQATIRFPKQDIEVKMRFLDVAGEFAAQDMIGQFAQKAQLIIMCYSIASMKSFKALDDWLDRINLDQRADALPIALIAT